VILRREIGKKREQDSRGKLIGWWNKEGEKRESRNKKNEETRKVVTRQI
jgi:hypothetical protein